jgi:hypothetical protein
MLCLSGGGWDMFIVDHVWSVCIGYRDNGVGNITRCYVGETGFVVGEVRTVILSIERS